MRPASAVQAHPSWREQEHYDLWVEWQQRDSAGRWHPHQPVTHRTFRTREDTLLHAERLINRGDFPMQGGSSAAPVTLLRNRRAALLSAFREAEGDGVTLIREALFPVGEYALSLRVTCERVADPVRATFASAANPLRSLAGQRVKLTVLIEHPYDVLTRAEGLLELGERTARIVTEVQTYAAGAAVQGVPYRNATVTVPRGFLKKPLLYRYELAAEESR
ncbi:hypothetical protein C8263_13230 [Deinococcus arcticus]|uniref:Uncharacterized protein n=1 Tax=Deinococcus arcticus TaxID=2136176 RepID=A0A2T3W6E2_9DEIO|nr:hypothetical protein C8263_13230 [Deinococcus arcticus]